jgi:hypothetical protein
MIFRVSLLRRNGRRLSRLDAINGPAYVGELQTVEGVSKEGRYKVAQLIEPGSLTRHLLPHLFEPVLVGIAPLAMVLRGFERMQEPEGYYSVVQEWHCEMP